MTTGKAARRARNKRRNYFTLLASEHPEQFEDEWEKRVDSWLVWIRRYAGKSHADDSCIPSVFAVIDEAFVILERCGEDIFVRYWPSTMDVLLNQCCVSFSREVVGKILKYKHRRFPET